MQWNVWLETSSVLATSLVAEPLARSISVCSLSSTLLMYGYLLSIIHSLIFLSGVNIQTDEEVAVKLVSTTTMTYSNSQTVDFYF